MKWVKVLKVQLRSFESSPLLGEYISLKTVLHDIIERLIHEAERNIIVTKHYHTNYADIYHFSLKPGTLTNGKQTTILCLSMHDEKERNYRQC